MLTQDNRCRPSQIAHLIYCAQVKYSALTIRTLEVTAHSTFPAIPAGYGARVLQADFIPQWGHGALHVEFACSQVLACSSCWRSGRLLPLWDVPPWWQIGGLECIHGGPSNDNSSATCALVLAACADSAWLCLTLLLGHQAGQCRESAPGCLQRNTSCVRCAAEYLHSSLVSCCDSNMHVEASYSLIKP